MSCAAACFHSGYGGAEGEPPYLLTQGRLGQPGQRHGKGFAMVCTTLNLPVCPAVLPMLVLISMSISVARATSEAIMPPVSIARYRPTIIGLQPDMPMSHRIDGRDDAVRARR